VPANWSTAVSPAGRPGHEVLEPDQVEEERVVARPRERLDPVRLVHLRLRRPRRRHVADDRVAQARDGERREIARKGHRRRRVGVQVARVVDVDVVRHVGREVARLRRRRQPVHAQVDDQVVVVRRAAERVDVGDVRRRVVLHRRRVAVVRRVGGQRQGRHQRQRREKQDDAFDHGSSFRCARRVRLSGPWPMPRLSVRLRDLLPAGPGGCLSGSRPVIRARRPDGSRSLGRPPRAGYNPAGLVCGRWARTDDAPRPFALAPRL
jgi:hypothetical protein